MSRSAHLGKLQNRDSVREPQAFCFRDIFHSVLLEFFPIGGTIFPKKTLKILAKCGMCLGHNTELLLS